MECWSTFVRFIRRNTIKKDTCEQTLLQQRFAMGGDLTPSEANAIRHYCSKSGRGIKNAHDSIEGFWEAYDEQGHDPTSAPSV